MIDITSSLTRLLYQQEEAAGAKVEIIHASAGYARARATRLSIDIDSRFRVDHVDLLECRDEFFSEFTEAGEILAELLLQLRPGNEVDAPTRNSV